MYREEQPNIDLILLDLIMPEMSGEETLAELLSFDPQAKVAICTGRTILGLPKKEQFRRAVSFIKKPFTAETLLTKVRKALDL
jgi:two-component system chemotaxis response regulator CheY